MKLKKNFYFPSIAEMFFLALFLYLSLTKGLGMLNDCDTGYHIRAGEWILNNFSIPRYDIFSFRTPALPWTAHEWLSEVIMALIHKAFGLTGVAIFFSAIIALVSSLLFRMIRSFNGSILVAVFITLLATISSQIHWLARPHVFSFLFFLLWYWILENYRQNRGNHLYLLPIILLLWVNLHGGYLAGFILLGIYILGEMPACLKQNHELKSAARRRIKSLLLMTGICLPVACINPYGFHILLFPFNLVGNKMIMNFVNEFMSPNFHDPTPFKYLLFLFIVVISLSKERMRPTDLLLILAFLNMSLYSARYIPLFSLVSAPILAYHIDLLLKNSQGKVMERYIKKSENIAAIDSSSGGILWPIIPVVGVTCLIVSGNLHYEFDPKIKPVAAVRFIEKAELTGNMFNNDEFGDYVIYATWPRYKVFFDGRSDMYGTKILKEYLKVIGFEKGWENILKKHHINWIFIGSDSHFSRVLATRTDWSLIYSDKVAAIFIRNTPQNMAIINQYSKNAIQGK